MKEVKILVLSADPEFAEPVIESWRRMQYEPNFSIATAEAAGDCAGSSVLLLDGVEALSNLSGDVVLAIAVIGDTANVHREEMQMEEPRPAEPQGQEPQERSGREPRVVRIRRTEGWAGQAAALAQETVLRLESQAQLMELQRRLREAERFAALGRFIADARHSLGNALTGVMGHSELLLLESQKGLPGEARAQVETIHRMSLKINETFHRLSSLDIELRLAERQAAGDSNCGSAN